MSRTGSGELPAAPARALGEVLDFMRLLWALDHALQKRSKQMQAELGITGPQRLVIRIVGRFPGIPAGQLAGILHLHPSTLTGILARLEHRGLITRRSDPRDRRRTLLVRRIDDMRFEQVDRPEFLLPPVEPQLSGLMGSRDHRCIGQVESGELRHQRAACRGTQPG